jgi:hypothetical protein
MSASGFFAYPEGRALVSDAILGAAELAQSKDIRLKLWQKVNITGFKLDNLIRDQIRSADFLAADITYPNCNVVYEIAYAIALGVPVIPTINTAIEKAVSGVIRIGLFDTIGWAQYNNASELNDKIQLWEANAWTGQYIKQKDHGQPLFILDSLKKTDFRNHIFHAVENSHVKYRFFDPTQVPRLTAAQAISEISSSSGVIVPFLDNEITDAAIHNLRAAFVLGLSHGFGIEPLAIQYENGPAPLDYRDFVTNSTFRKETENHVEKYCASTLVWNQSAAFRNLRSEPGLLGDIDLGSPTAENEIQKLGYYFVRTAEFARALRAEGAVVIGRKGSGKSAVFFQISEMVSKDRRSCIVDLRPASHNLSEMREALFGIVTAGVFDHTIYAFWQYMMYVEILLKIREMALPKSRNSFEIQERIRAVEKEFSLSESVVSGDFTSRLEAAVRHVIKVAGKIDNAADLRSQLTNIMFEEPIHRLRETIISLNDFFDNVIVLIDDLDKGWPPRQVEEHDIATVKHLIEVLNRIQRDLNRRRVNCRHLIFLRSDIYEKLVEQTSDRGKYNVINVDWSQLLTSRRGLWSRDAWDRQAFEGEADCVDGAD